MIELIAVWKRPRGRKVGTTVRLVTNEQMHTATNNTLEADAKSMCPPGTNLKFWNLSYTDEDELRVP